MKQERTKNAVRNIAWGIIDKIVNLLIPFALRTVFIYTLGAEYLGLNSLFTAILTVLNLAELGFSAAVVYNMYKPVAEKDTETICALMNYYKTTYRIIGCVVTVAGLAVIPFLECFIEGEYPKDINLTFLYVLFLGNTAISYFLFAYKRCILLVHQRSDIVSKINILMKAGMYFLQALFLVLLKNYYGYVICMITNTILSNLAVAYCAEKRYPQYQCKGILAQEHRNTIRKNIRGLMIGKLCMVSRNAFDNIFLSAFLGLRMVGIYGNYYYIMNAVSGILVVVATSVGAGIGNSVATETTEKNHRDFQKFTFLYSWISSWCAVCLFCLYQPFMELWVGKDMMLPIFDVALFCLYFYTLTMGNIRSQYATACGLFWENRFYVLAEAAANLVLNYFLGKRFGIHGIIIATWIPLFFVNFGWGTSVLFKHYFKEFSLISYYKAQMLYMGNAAIATLITFAVTNCLSNTTVFSFVLQILVCIVLPNAYFLLTYYRRKECRVSLAFVQRNILQRLRKS